MSRLEKRFETFLGDIDFRNAAPGVRVQAYLGGRKKIDVAVGDTHRFYDWASVTKIVFTTSALMMKQDAGLFSAAHRVDRYVDWFPSKARVSQLLTHSAGLTWWYPFYREVIRKTEKNTSPEAAWATFQTILKRKILADHRRHPSRLARPTRTVYSDLDFFLLGRILEEVSEKSLWEVWQETSARMGLELTDFHRDNRPPKMHPRSQCAPTEDCAWRGRLVRGEVHDQNTWSLKGVAPHAGLFGPIEDLSRWGLLLRQAMRGENSRRFASSRTVGRYTKRAIPRARGDWALGFMMPSLEGASCGRYFSKASVGHTGFTGTSIWYDPRKDLLVSVLSNRIHPSVENLEIRNLRPKIHDWIHQEV